MLPINRRNFLKNSSLAALPALVATPVLAMGTGHKQSITAPQVIKFFGDGEMFEPIDYLNILQQANSTTGMARDSYGAGGSVEALEKKFATKPCFTRIIIISSRLLKEVCSLIRHKKAL